MNNVRYWLLEYRTAFLETGRLQQLPQCGVEFFPQCRGNGHGGV
jgi:hypothetical protein